MAFIHLQRRLADDQRVTWCPGKLHCTCNELGKQRPQSGRRGLYEVIQYMQSFNSGLIVPSRYGALYGLHSLLDQGADSLQMILLVHAIILT